MANKKIVFFDIDGTIYRYDIGIPKDVFISINKLKMNGHIPVICTGRTRCMLYNEFLTPGFDYLICGGGTYIEEKGNQIYLHEMNKADIQKVVTALEENCFVPVAEGKDNIFLGTDYSDLTIETKKVVRTYHEKMKDAVKTTGDEGSISKVSALFTNHSNERNMTERFQERYSIINHNNNLLELIPKPYNKAFGIKILLEKLGIPIENTYAFGDSFNDIDMLQYVKYGCAMGNSHPELFDFVSYRTDDFDKGGITNALEKFGLI